MTKSSFQEKLLERFCGKQPSNWKTIRLAEFFSERVERREPDESFPLYSFTIESGVTPKTDRYERSFLVKEDGEDSFKTVHPGDFVMNPMNLRWGAIGQSKTKAPVTVSGYYDVLIPKFNKGAGFLQSLLRSYQILSLYDIVATGSLLEKKRVHCSQFLDLCIYWPPEPELEKLCDILTTWDEALTKLDALIEAQERRKKALMQRLLSRSSAHSQTSHAQHRLGDVIERVTRRNTVGSTNVLTISAQGGLVNQQEYFNRSVAAEDLSGYYLLRQGEFAYNRSSAKGYPFGAIKRLDSYDQGVVSTLYLCFRLRDGAQASSAYLCHYFEGGYLNSGLRMIAKEGARAHGLLNVTADEFFDLDIFLPTLPEQQKIAEILDTADQQITLLRTQRTALDQQKRGLMQRLLTGKMRVKAVQS